MPIKLRPVDTDESMTDTERQEKEKIQELHLLAIGSRSMSLPFGIYKLLLKWKLSIRRIGRGALVLSTMPTSLIIPSSIHVPEICLEGKIIEEQIKIHLDNETIKQYTSCKFKLNKFKWND